MKIKNFIIINFQQIFTFCLIGVLGASLNYSVFLFSLILLNFNYIIAGIIGFLFPIPIVFILNRKWTFKSNVKYSRISYYFIANIIALSCHSLTQFLAKEILDVAEIYTQLFGIIITPTINFLISKFFVFKEKKKTY